MSTKDYEIQQLGKDGKWRRCADVEAANEIDALCRFRHICTAQWLALGDFKYRAVAL